MPYRLAVSMIVVLFGTLVARGADAQPARLPIVFIAGDSTVHNHDGLVGWGDILSQYFDPAKITVENCAMGGRSSRTFIQEGRWEAIRSQLRPGDFVLLQFGHNDSKSTLSANRYSLPGLGDETVDAMDATTKQPLTIHTYGYYMRQMIRETVGSGAVPIVFSPVPRNKWSQGKIVRGEEHTGEWAAAVAKELKVPFVDLNGMIADRYEAVGASTIKARYFPKDNTHNNQAGAEINAACVVLGLMGVPGLGLTADLKATAAEEAKAAATIPAATEPAAGTPGVTTAPDVK